MFTFATRFAGVVKLADTLDLGSSAARLGGSSPSTRTKKQEQAGTHVSAFFKTIKKLSRRLWLR